MLSEIYKFLSVPSPERDGLSWGMLILFIISIIIDVSKVPVNPWKHIIRGISAVFNAELISSQKDLQLKVEELGTTFRAQHDDLEAKITKIEEAQLEGQKKAIRRQIIGFADECRRGTEHSQQAFITILDDVSEYAELCRKTGDKNHVVNEHVAYIDQLFHERLEKNDFI